MKEKTISELGKFGLITHLTEKAGSINESTKSRIGDDSAVIDYRDRLTLVTTDLLLEGIHFNLVYTPLKHLGYKAVSRGISDIYAMNGTPGQIMISLGLSTRFTTGDISELYEGIYLACRKYSVDLAGGDTTSSVTGLTIGVTAIGHVNPERLVGRDGAKPNELICVTGDLGAAYMGLQLLERERKLFEGGNGSQPDLAGKEYIIERQLKPELPVAVLKELESSELLPTSMIDITDSLATDILLLCKNSGTGCRIYSEKIPVDTETASMADEMGINPLMAAINGGDDYELLFTLPLDSFDRISRIRGIRVIGHMTQAEYGSFIVLPDGSETEITSRAWGTPAEEK
ncbi:MAG: thiamine-phosphate kinase [Bacteroidales bacterium]